jgi:peptidoglycan hydrolase-like protein with peptidoglycan-binding domain
MKKKIIVSILFLSLVLSPGVAFAQNSNSVSESLQNQINQLLTQIKSLQQQLDKLNQTEVEEPVVCAETDYIINRNLYPGQTDVQTGGNVTKLQNFLKSERLLDEALPNGFYGKATQQAVEKFQSSNELVSSGTPASTGFGSFGPRTRKLLSVKCVPPRPNTSIKVTSPNGGETLLRGTNYRITWDNQNNFSNTIRQNYPLVDISLLPHDGLYPTPPTPVEPQLMRDVTGSSAVANDLSADPLIFFPTHSLARNIVNAGSFNWLVGNNSAGQPISDGKYRVQVCYTLDVARPIGSTGIYDEYQTSVVSDLVRTRCDVSDGDFKLVSETNGGDNRPPSITEINGPSQLEVGTTGKWSIKAVDPEGGDLRYKVVWGDEGSSGTYPPSTSVMDTYFRQEATFTHQYARPGVYNPTFIVVDNQGKEARTSLSVNVEPEVSTVQTIPITVKVLDGDIQCFTTPCEFPIQGARIEVKHISGRHFTGVVLSTNENGLGRVKYLTTGEYEITVTHPDFETAKKKIVVDEADIEAGEAETTVLLHR